MFYGEEKLKTTEDNTSVNFLFFFKVALFGHILEKPTHPHGHSSWSTFTLNLVRGPKAL
jgi:hypothetical protein